MVRRRTPKQMVAAYAICLAAAWLLLCQFGLAGNVAFLGASVVVLFAKDVADVASAKWRGRITFGRPLLDHCPYSVLVAAISPVAWVAALAAADAALGFAKDIATLGR